MDELNDFAIQAMEDHPQHRDKILDIVQLATVEVDGGGCPAAQIVQAKQDIRDLVGTEKEDAQG